MAIAMNFYDVTSGGPTPSAEVTPRQCRLPTRPTWLGRVWLTLTAQPRRVYRFSNYKNFTDELMEISLSMMRVTWADWTWRASPAARRASAMVRLGSEMAMATEATRKTLELVAMVSRAATASLDTPAALPSEVGTADCARYLGVTGAMGLTVFFTPGHTTALETVMRFFGMALSCPARAGRGRARSSYLDFVQHQVDVRSPRAMIIITITIRFSRITISDVFYGLLEVTDSRTIMKRITAAAPGRRCIMTAIKVARSGMMMSENANMVSRERSVISANAEGDIIVPIINAPHPAEDEEDGNQEGAIDIEGKMRTGHGLRKPRPRLARAPAPQAKERRWTLRGCNLALTSLRSIRPKCACIPVAPAEACGKNRQDQDSGSRMMKMTRPTVAGAATSGTCRNGVMTIGEAQGQRTTMGDEQLNIPGIALLEAHAGWLTMS